MQNHQPAQLPPFDAAAKIYSLERRILENAAPPARPVWGQLDAGPLLRINGLADFWETNPTLNFEQQTDDLLIGFYGQRLSVLFLVLGAPAEVQVYLGLQSPDTQPDPALLTSALTAAFPGILLAAAPEQQLGAALKNNPVFNCLGRLTGIPTRKDGATLAAQPASNSHPARPADKTTSGGYQLERLLRGMTGQSWGYLVRAEPIPYRDITALNQSCFQDLTSASAHVRLQYSRQKQTMHSVGPHQQESLSESLNRDMTDYQTQYCLELLEQERNRLTVAQAIGMWHTSVVYFAPTPGGLNRLAALLRAILAGPDSRPNPIRTFTAQPGQGGGRDEFVTPLISTELGTLMQLPREEFPGYRLAPYTRFDVDLLPPSAGKPLHIGKILDAGRDTGSWFALAYTDLAKHGLVAGVTGSGKTNTLFYLLERLWRENKTPFLVIEPAKTEYRHLRAGAIADLQIYTLGDERWSPFRLNPFEFEIFDAENRIHVQTHIDYLKSVFNAAFILYAPMPYILETCLHEVYQDRGWDLTTGHNRRLPPTSSGQPPPEYSYPVFPTLADLYHKIDEVVDRLGYEERIQMDVKAGLKARIGSLMLGSKGLMLGARHSIPMADLLAQPTVLELEAIGNDDEKAFVIGLILTRLYEYRRVQAMSGAALPPLQHVAVFEEAHRLLKNVSTEVDTESANLKGQAVEAFANMLSEIRAYGQGVLIAEQIPAKLAPDAIKNTNLKLMQRIVAEDDRQALGGTMNLDERQSRFVTSLSAGQAVAYAEGADRPYLLQIPAHTAKQSGSQKLTNRQVKQAMAQALTAPRYDPVPGYSRYLTGGLSPHLRDLALQITSPPAFRAHFQRYFLSAWLNPAYAIQGYGPLLKLIQQETANHKLTAAELTQLTVAVLLHALDDLFTGRGRGYNWLYNVAATMRSQAAEALAQVAQQVGAANAQPSPQLAGQVQAKLKQFETGYRQQTRRKDGPFTGCIFCGQKCLYRFEAAPLAADKSLEQDFIAAINHSGDAEAMWQALADVSLRAAGAMVDAAPPATRQELALCFAVQLSAAQNFGPNNERKLAQSVRIKLTGK